MQMNEVNQIKNKVALAVAQSLYKIICCHECFEIKIYDQGSEFVNLVSKELPAVTGVE